MAFKQSDLRFSLSNLCESLEQTTHALLKKKKKKHFKFAIIRQLIFAIIFVSIFINSEYLREIQPDLNYAQIRTEIAIFF